MVTDIQHRPMDTDAIPIHTETLISTVDTDLIIGRSINPKSKKELQFKFELVIKRVFDINAQAIPLRSSLRIRLGRLLLKRGKADKSRCKETFGLLYRSVKFYINFGVVVVLSLNTRYFHSPFFGFFLSVYVLVVN